MKGVKEHAITSTRNTASIQSITTEVSRRN